MKIFGVGLNKTGTTTLGICGRKLNLRTTGSNKHLLQDYVEKKDLSRIFKKASKFDLFQDWPWPLVYKELDKEFPNSKFILTTRIDEFKWLESLKSHSMITNPSKHCRKLAYGYDYPHMNEQSHIDQYLKHNNDVRCYFQNRNSDFLDVCWERGDGWPELCAFLGLEVPDVEFPRSNVSSEKLENSKDRILANQKKLDDLLSRQS